MKYRTLIALLVHSVIVSSAYAGHSIIDQSTHSLPLNDSPGFFRFSFDDLSMPGSTQHMGLLGFDYLVELNSYLYGGVGTYGAVTGTQGGLFVLGVDGGIHHSLIGNWWGEAGLFAGGGGGKSSLVGGGLMLRPYLGIAYAFPWLRVGLHYSDIHFPDGRIHSQQIGVDLDIPTDFYYLTPGCMRGPFHGLHPFQMVNGRFLDFERNDFAVLLQTYRQRAGTRSTDGDIQDGAIGLVGAELDHYVTETSFWWIKASGALSGIPNGYMDVIGGLGYHAALGVSPFSLVPQFGIGAGGGAGVDTGGGLLLYPQLGLEWSLFPSVSLRLSSGYLWAPNGSFKAVPITAEWLYHLNFATGSTHPHTGVFNHADVLGLRIQLLNQTYFHPQRHAHATRTPINLIGVQIDQLFSPHFFFSYQGAAAYSGYHAGGYATGMIGPGLASASFLHEHLQYFMSVLVGAGGGGGLSLNSGALIAPLIGIRYAFTPFMGLQASASQIKALNDHLNTPALNIGFTIRFDTLNRI